jgi:oligopeptide/dipeptide ABC transporter ATP-binding protein
MVFITHDLPLVAELCTRVAVLYAFQFVEVSPTAELLNEAAHPYTRALLNATPNLDADLSQMQAIDGASPDPVDVPAGCSYHPRCPLATQKCRDEDPPFHEASATHQTKCFHWEESIAEIPLSHLADAGEVGCE